MMGRLGLVGLVLFGAASVAFYRINDRIVWDICRRENRPYRQDWTLSVYWQWRSLKGWYADARRAGLLWPRALATAAVILTFVGSVLAGILASQPS
ncbi:hypothetical protein [Microvirga rosea]|uniref:hypothetical protein n=1 Tax=Microvirga rosea TaxID=2715425 RepID=UPI001D09BDE2|nr:hypothetical protein [Microvirga rosea]MCB8821552.1 hypothetical protein [Microvirga rosea]